MITVPASAFVDATPQPSTCLAYAHGTATSSRAQIRPVKLSGPTPGRIRHDPRRSPESVLSNSRTPLVSTRTREWTPASRIHIADTLLTR